VGVEGDSEVCGYCVVHLRKLRTDRILVAKSVTRKEGHQSRPRDGDEHTKLPWRLYQDIEVTAAVAQSCPAGKPAQAPTDRSPITSQARGAPQTPARAGAAGFTTNLFHIKLFACVFKFYPPKLVSNSVKILFQKFPSATFKLSTRML
jgi:hypothetical protein